MSDLYKMGCDEFADAAAELALGALTGRDRAKAIAHLDQCEACRENVRQLTMTAEDLLGLLPVAEPPPGFETGVIERLGLASPSPRRGLVSRTGPVRFPGSKTASRADPARAGPTRRELTVAAVVLAGAVAGLGGWGLRAATSTPARSPLSSAALLTASGQTVGKIFFYDGTSRWIYMSVSMGPENGGVICQLETRDGHYATVGSFWLTDGYASWGSADPVNTGPLAGARLLSTDSTVLATASISGELGALWQRDNSATAGISRQDGLRGNATCTGCGTSHQRDDNAAINLARYEPLTTGDSTLGPVRAAVKRGADRKARPRRAGGDEARKGPGQQAEKQPRDEVPRSGSL